MRFTCVAVSLITEIITVMLLVTLEGAVDTGAIMTLELIWSTSGMT